MVCASILLLFEGCENVSQSDVRNSGHRFLGILGLKLQQLIDISRRLPQDLILRYGFHREIGLLLEVAS
jgi:hypothetical protein